MSTVPSMSLWGQKAPESMWVNFLLRTCSAEGPRHTEGSVLLEPSFLSDIPSHQAADLYVALPPPSPLRLCPA